MNKNYDINASERVYNYIVNNISDETWRTGDKIWAENKLSEELQVSRASVRQAIEKLSALSILHKVRGSGTYVKRVDTSVLLTSVMSMLHVSDNDMLSILEFRKYFEYGNVLMFVQNNNSEQIEKLERSYQIMEKNIDSADLFSKADYDFHNIIAEGTKNDFVIRISLLMHEILATHQIYLYQVVGPTIGIEYHKHILDNIKKGDAELAALYMRRHIEETIKQNKRLLKQKMSN